jgi:hypothetical protein
MIQISIKSMLETEVVGISFNYNFNFNVNFTYGIY